MQMLRRAKGLLRKHSRAGPRGRPAFANATDGAAFVNFVRCPRFVSGCYLAKGSEKGFHLGFLADGETHVVWQGWE